MTSAGIFVNALTEFYKSNPYGPGFAKRLEPFCQNIGADLASEIAGRVCGGSTRFPTLKLCQKALQEAEARVLAPVGTGGHWWERKAEDQAKWAARLEAIRMCRQSEIGRQADRELWLTTLLEFCEDNGRLPDAREVEGLKRRNRAIDDNLHRDPKPFNYAALCNLRAAMIERAHRDVFGENYCGND